MNINITTFTNPFSFFCKIVGENECSNLLEKDVDGYSNYQQHYKNNVSDFNHGQYVAVLWKNKWNRGVISMETQFLIWLVDYGFYLRPDNKTVFITLPTEHKTYPTKIFEASIHGVTPLDKSFSEFLEITNHTTTVWNTGAVEKSQGLIKSALKIIFAPIALLSTKHNDIVLGDLYLHLPNRGIVNLVDELELWPVFIERNKETYVQNFPIYYNSHRKHRACLLKPEFDNLKIPAISLGISLEEYSAICENVPEFEGLHDYSETTTDSTSSEGGSTIKQKYHLHKWTADELDKYAHTFVTIYGKKYNVLNILLNKLRDLHMCKKYRDHDLKSVGRANHRLSRHNTDRVIDHLFDDFV